MSSSISIGRYVPYDSFIHKLDPRFKFLAMILLMVSVFLKFETLWMNFIVYGVLVIFVLIILFVGHVKLSSLFKQLRAMWFMVLFLLIINMVIPGDDSLGLGYFTIFGGWNIYYVSLVNTAYIAIRLIIMVALSLVLTSTTTPLELTGALEWFMAPLKYIKFPVHEIAMTISLALRFIPTLLDETYRIMKAQASRGVDFENGKFKEKIKAIVSLIIPLFISSFQRSEDLANAMEARGYDPLAKRTRYRINKWHWRDTISSLFMALFFTGLILLMVYHIDLVSLIQTWIGG
jgi:energy-coupling factor transport system permease protein